MKNYILLLFIPIVCFGQTYEDIVSIDSKEQFIRVGVENDYEIIENSDNLVKMGYNPTYEDNGDILALKFSEFKDSELLRMITFQFVRKNSVAKREYDEIFNIVKEKHEFKRILTDVSYYSIDKYLEIGFAIEKGWCYVFLVNYSYLKQMGLEND